MKKCNVTVHLKSGAAIDIECDEFTVKQNGLGHITEVIWEGATTIFLFLRVEDISAVTQRLACRTDPLRDRSTTMSSAKSLTQNEYKAARGLLARTISGTEGTFAYYTEEPEPHVHLLAEKLLDAGVIDIDALATSRETGVDRG